MKVFSLACFNGARYVRDNSDDNKMAAALARAGLTWRAAFHPEVSKPV